MDIAPEALKDALQKRLVTYDEIYYFAKIERLVKVILPCLEAEDIRNQMGLRSGDQFLVVAEKDVVILKVISKPDMGEYRELIEKTRSAAKRAGLTKKDVLNGMKKAREKG